MRSSNQDSADRHRRRAEKAWEKAEAARRAGESEAAREYYAEMMAEDAMSATFEELAFEEAA